MPKEISVSGTVWGAFKHRFAIETADGKALVDIGPKAAEKLKIAEGDRVEIEGEAKPSEIKVHAIEIGGKKHKIEWGPKAHGHKERGHKDHGPKHHGPKHHGPKHHVAKHHDDDASPDAAKRAVEAEGYEVSGDPERHPRHWAVPARREGRAYDIHVELDGEIRHIKPLR